MRDEQRVYVDAILRASEAVKVHLRQHCRVESGGGPRLGERGVHLQRIEGENHPLGTTESTGIRTRTKKQRC
jgi:hypothetical protein